MSENPYATPQAQSPQTALHPAKAPSPILRKIAAGWIVGGLMTTLNLLLSIRAIAAGDSAKALIHCTSMLLVAALAYGTYRKSRIAACLLLASYVLARISHLVAGNADGLGIAVLVTLAYLSAARGTFQYHRWLRQEQRVPAEHRQD
ncbi:hypothetical protein [Xanthomonas indica]|uniref:MerC mercury resistance protein n=1 Tax=Xanthomonas indica TaxID=2912242 RepID=A0AAU8I9P1_9XANT|nr:hypothetical protein [Xanthomonas indica]MCI2259954.1 hypothetical protein [Xanthomonas indica]